MQRQIKQRRMPSQNETSAHHNTSISSMTLRTLRAVKLSSLILGYFAIAAPAAGAVECPDDSDAVTTYAVDYARASTGFEVSMYGGPVGADGEPYDIDASRITSPSVSVNGVPTPLVFNEVGVASAILSSPQVKTATVIFTWTQDAGTPMACDGRDVYRFPIIPRGAKAGDTSVSRLSGVYRVAWRSLSADRSSLTPSRWTIRPACQYFACDLRVRSNGGMGRARFVLNAEDDTYRFLREHFGRQGWCETTNVFTGVRRRAEPAYLVSARVTIRPRRAVNGVAREFTGKWTDSYSRLKRARDIQCSTPSDTEWRVTAKRIAP